MQDVKRQQLGQLRQQGQGARRSPSLFRGILGRQRHGYNFARELVGVVQYLLGHCLGGDADEGAYDDPCDGAFDVRDVEVQEEIAQCEDGIMVLRQSGQLISTPRRKFVLLLRQTRPYCMFLLQTKK